MFQISDVMVDKEEVAMALNLCIRVQDCAQDMAQPGCASDCSDQRFKIAHGDSDYRSPEALENTGRLLHNLPLGSSIGYIPYPIASESYGNTKQRIFGWG